jgi:hypothetical protein
MSRAGSGGKLSPETLGTTVEIHGVWVGGGAGTDMTRESGAGIESVAYNAAAGVYDITLSGRYQELSGWSFGLMNAATAAAQNVATLTSYTASSGVVKIWVTDVATPTGADLATSEKISINLWLRTEGVYT